MTNSIVREKAMNLSVEVHRLVKNLPEEEVLAEMLIHSAADVAVKISQAESASTAEERIDLLVAARGKIAAVETQLSICVNVEFLQEAQIEAALNLCAEVRKILDSELDEA